MGYKYECFTIEIGGDLHHISFNQVVSIVELNEKEFVAHLTEDAAKLIGSKTVRLSRYNVDPLMSIRDFGLVK